MEIVASKFERDGLIDYKEFVNSLKDKKPVRASATYNSVWYTSICPGFKWLKAIPQSSKTEES